MTEVRRLLVVSHVVHYRQGDRLFAFGPYAREIDVWADLFPEVVIASPLRDEPPPGDAVAFTRPNIRVWPLPETGGMDASAKIRQVLALPALAWGLVRAIRRADAVHVRCPGNLGLLGVALAPAFSRRLVAKYAGQWNGYPGERLSVRLQRSLLASRWWKGPVTVYGDWPDQPPQVIPFFTSMMTSEMVERAVESAAVKDFSGPLRVLFAGRLEAVKRVPVLLDAVRAAIDRGASLELTILGGGSQEADLRRQAERLGLGGVTTFVGALPYEEAVAWYERAHCLVLPSTHSEGWPKVVAEAMCYGLVCVAVDHGQVGRMLGGRGVLLKSGSADEIADALLDVASRPEDYREVAARASVWARQYSLEGLREALRDLLERSWGVRLGQGAEAGSGAGVPG